MTSLVLFLNIIYHVYTVFQKCFYLVKRTEIEMSGVEDIHVDTSIKEKCNSFMNPFE